MEAIDLMRITQGGFEDKRGRTASPTCACALNRVGTVALAPSESYMAHMPTLATTVPTAIHRIVDDPDCVSSPPENRGIYPEFGALCELLDKLQKGRKQEMRRTYLTKWFSVRLGSAYCSSEVKRSGNAQVWRERVGMDLYPLLRLILPQVISHIALDTR